ncbi:hypothetical protein Moror_9772 [Moniliophthora roreri MCA 2997]|uniref:Uncharacterized protein n=1 Tax=Moniliophthora roreri (strain MCA 2997) TaxID=1381753 RepID=V2Y4M1_MONRO|nr:hypothetical protein Moror_9772 [Moniliophthora roreri MCA 2997]
MICLKVAFGITIAVSCAIAISVFEYFREFVTDALRLIVEPWVLAKILLRSCARVRFVTTGCTRLYMYLLAIVDLMGLVFGSPDKH